MIQDTLQIVMLPTEEKTKVLKVYSDVDKEDYKLSYNRPKNDEYKEYQHLYLIETNPSELKEGDWVISLTFNNQIGKVISTYGDEFTVMVLSGDICYWSTNEELFKIESSTDDRLDLRELSDKFLEIYCIRNDIN